MMEYELKVKQIVVNEEKKGRRWENNDKRKGKVWKEEEVEREKGKEVEK